MLVAAHATPPLFTAFVAGALAFRIGSPPRASAAMAALPFGPDPAGLPCGGGTAASPRVAADQPRAELILAAWSADPDVIAARSEPTKWERTVYHADGDDATPLHGLLVHKQAASRQRPGILLVHTAVGPHDLFLSWKAESLASLGYVVLIVDMLGDATGLGWEPEWAAAARAPVVADRELSRARLGAAMRVLVSSGLVDASRLGAVGYCFGGRSVLDLARGAPAGLRAVVSFHGVLDAEPLASGVTSLETMAFLLCHADGDAFVPAESVSACTRQLEEHGAEWSLLAFGRSRHAFTNPAQALNPNPAFGYNQVAADEAWAAAKRLLARTLELHRG